MDKTEGRQVIDMAIKEYEMLQSRVRAVRTMRSCDFGCKKVVYHHPWST